VIDLIQLFTYRTGLGPHLCQEFWNHALCRLARQIDWKVFDDRFGPLYDDRLGRTGKPTRLMAGIHYLKHAFNESDESVVARWVENPYWQYFCGFEYFQHRFPIDPSSMTRWRRRVGEEGVELLLKETIATAQRSDHIKHSDVERVTVDTTVQEKAIAYPTDARLYHKAIVKLGWRARHDGIVLRQSYVRVSKRTLQKQGRYAHAKQFKRARRMTKKLRTMLGRLLRDIERKCPSPSTDMAELISRCWRLHAQQRNDKNKLYSLWAPEVECISKGKAHKRYEFGCKVGVVSTTKKNWIVGIQAFHGNPYDGHTLAQSIEQVERLTVMKVEHAFVDKGYRGSKAVESVPSVEVHWPDHRRKDRSLRRWMRRRSAVEPVIGHAKSDHRMDRNFLHGKEGDLMNALLAGCGFNLRKLLRELSRSYFWLRTFVLWAVWGENPWANDADRSDIACWGSA
jgi:IS5 family transposase